MKNNMNLTEIKKNFVENILNPLREEHSKNGYYIHDNEEYMSYKTREFNFNDFIATNLDWIYYTPLSNTLMIIEQKSLGKTLSIGQKIVFEILDDSMKKIEYVNYIGFYELVFENNCFEDGIVTLRQLFTHKPKIYTFNSYEEYKKWVKKTFKQ